MVAKRFFYVCAGLLCLAFACRPSANLLATTAWAQSAKSARKTLLQPYLVPYTPTRLEMDLLWANTPWYGAYTDGYLRTSSVFYRVDRAQIFAAVTVHDMRSATDPEPFTKLPEYQRRAILQGAVDHLLRLLEPSLPVLKEHPELVLVEFWFYPQGAGSSHAVIAQFEDGRLVLSP